MTELDSTTRPEGPSVDGAAVHPAILRPTPAVMPPRRVDPDDVPLPEEIERAQARVAAEKERKRVAAREARQARAVRPVRPAPVPTDDGPVADQMTAGRLAEFLQDVQAGTLVWQVADSDDDRELVPVQFVEVLKVNGVVERLVIK